MKLLLTEIADLTHAELLSGSGDPPAHPATGYSIDTRTLKPGDLFFAIRGERHDAHDFVSLAFTLGARAAVIARGRAGEFLQTAEAHPLLIVEDPLAALQALAAAVRGRWNRQVIAVTGSAGKTTTKEAIAEVLSSRFTVLRSKGNFNNAFGLPLELLKLREEDEAAVVEMGMSHAGEIAALVRIARPDWGVVTNAGTAHAENFPDGRAGIARAKRELIEGLPPEGIAFLNCDDDYVAEFGQAFSGRSIRYGTGERADARAEEIEELGAEGLRFMASIHGQRTPVHLRLLGRHNVLNAMAAIATGVEAGIPLEECAAAVGRLRPPDRRGELLHMRGATLINDCYNSNPEALKSMIAALAAMPAKRRILVAGEMLELGPEAARLHRECGEAAARLGIDLIAGVRGQALELVEAAIHAGGTALFFPSPAEAGEWLKSEMREGDAVLLKASRGVGLERALKILENEEVVTAAAPPRPHTEAGPDLS